MKKVTLLFCVLIAMGMATAQEIVELPHKTPDGISWEGNEKQYYSKIWQNEVVTNVSLPTMQVYRPESANGTSVIIAPGGGLYALSILSEGNHVAEWLNKKGITAFVLKYRLVPTGEDGVQEITDLANTNPMEIGMRVQPVLPFSIADGLAAISHVRKNAEKYGVAPNKIGFMGFSAGGAVTMGVGYNYSDADRPDFLVPVYPWTDVLPPKDAPSDAPPMLIVCATDDPLGLASGSIELYSKWFAAKKPVGLHMYAKGGHGFGMKKQGLPSDSWIQRFYDWSVAEGLTTVDAME